MLRSFGKRSLVIDLAIWIMFLVISLNSKQILNDIVIESVKSLLPESVTEKIGLGENWLEEIGNNEKVKKYINGENGLSDKWDSTKGEISEYVDEQIEAQEEKLDPKQQMIIKAIRLLTATVLKYFIIAAIVLTIILMIVSYSSFYKWIKGASWSLVISGLLLLLTCVYLEKILAAFISTDNISFRMIQTPAIYLIVGGVIIRFIYKVFEIISNINQKNNWEGDVPSEIS